MAFANRTFTRHYALARYLKNRVILLSVLLIIVIGMPAWAQSYSPGMERALQAFNAGDAATAIALLKDESKAGNWMAAHTLGILYQQGNGIGIDLSQSFGFFLRAATLNPADTEANFFLGSMYLNGKGVAANPAKGMQYLRRSADQGFPQAMQQIVIMNINGNKNTPADEELTLKYLKELSRLGDPKAQTLYRDRVGVLSLLRPNRQNLKDYRNILKQLADAGDAAAQKSLGTELSRRYEFDEAIRYFQLAAAQGINVEADIQNTRKDKSRIGRLPDLTGVYAYCYAKPAFGNRYAFSSVFAPDNSNFSQQGQEFLAYASKDTELGKDLVFNMGCLTEKSRDKLQAMLSDDIAAAKKAGVAVHLSRWPD